MICFWNYKTCYFSRVSMRFTWYEARTLSFCYYSQIWFVFFRKSWSPNPKIASFLHQILKSNFKDQSIPSSFSSGKKLKKQKKKKKTWSALFYHFFVVVINHLSLAVAIVSYVTKDQISPAISLSSSSRCATSSSQSPLRHANTVTFRFEASPYLLISS